MQQRIHKAYMPLSEKRIQDLIVENEKMIEKSKFDEEIRHLKDKNNKLRKLVEYMKVNTKKGLTEFNIKLNTKGYGIIQGVQIPLYEIEDLLYIINTDIPIDENIGYNLNIEKANRQRRPVDDFKLYFSVYDLGGELDTTIDNILWLLNKYGVKYLYIGSKLYIFYNEIPENNTYEYADGFTKDIRRAYEIVLRSLERDGRKPIFKQLISS